MPDFIYLLEHFLIFISAPFLEILNISITAGWAVLAVVAVRLLFRKAPKWLTCALWGIVALRLALPFSVESIFSLIPSTQTVNPSAFYDGSFEINTGFSAVDSTVTNIYNSADISADTGVEIAGIAALIWILGAFILASYAFISFMRLKLKLRTAIKKEENIYQSESVSSPFVLGIFRPKIYLSYNTAETDIPLVVAHEKAHIKRLDHIIKPLGFLLLSVHWFNPLMWVAYILLCRDIEAACDEKVIRELGEDCRRSYSTALLNASISRRSIAACPLAFGEVGVKERIKGVMNYKKPAFWVVIAAVAVCIITAVCFLTNPKGSEKTDYTPKISDRLDRVISLNIIEHNQGKYLDGMMSFEAHKVLATKSSTDDNSDKKITVYLIALYEEYSEDKGKLVDVSGGITPLALTYLIGEDISTGEDTYALTEYWEPGMGSDYIKDLEAKFPKGVDYDTQTYVKELEEDCIAQAAEYFGLSENDITEQHSVEMTTVMFEAKSEYELTVTKSQGEGITWMTDMGFYKNNGYHAYLYCLDEAYVTIDGKDIYIGDALNSGKMDADILLKKAEEDLNAGKIANHIIKDGGTKIYLYKNYSIIKRNTLEGNRDLIIGPAKMSVTDYSSCVEFIANGMKNYEITTVPDEINGVTADISPEAEPKLTGKVTSASDNTIYMELTSDQSGIKKGTPVTVRLGSMLSYAPQISTSMLKKGDIVTVIYDGRVMETYPLQIDALAAYKIVE